MSVKRTVLSVPARVLLLANMLPLIGVVYFDWDLLTVMMLFWSESAIIGAYNILKMIRINWGSVFFLVPFFVVHYSIFMFGHLAFIFSFFGTEDQQFRSFLPPAELVLSFLPVLGLPLLAFVISHGISYVKNFIGKKEYANRHAQMQMFFPYGRIVAMHLAIIFGGILTQMMDSTLAPLIILVLLKTIMDLASHNYEHDKISLNDYQYVRGK